MREVMDLIHKRHSVRRYYDQPIAEEIRRQLDAYVEKLNNEGSLHIQIVYDEPECFNTRLAHYGSFENCTNYIAMVGTPAADLEERCGWYGELLVLEAQRLGLNTCWAALTHGKSKAILNPGEKEVILIALGYGKTQGDTRKSKRPEEVSDLSNDSPAWYRNGISAALLAPTAVNQQKFRFTRDGNRVSAKPGLLGTCLKIDLGIVKCHFELGAGKENFEWA